MRIWATKIIPLCLISVRALIAAPISFSPGSLLTGQVAFPTSTLYQYTPGGSPTGSLLLAEGLPTGISGLAESLTFLNGALYVGDETGIINRIDPASGNVILHFGTAGYGLTSLGDYLGNLLALSFNSTSVGIYAPSGTLQKSVALQATPPTFLLEWNRFR